MMSSSNFRRREFLTHLAMASAAMRGSTVPFLSEWNEGSPPSFGGDYTSHGVIPLADPGEIRKLATLAIDAAENEGADYADVRLTRTVSSQSGHLAARSWVADDREYLAVGVRVLVNGQWGFAASPYWTATEMPRLATLAVAQARENARGSPANVVMTPATTPNIGRWTMPGIDPFSVPIEERNDFMMAWMQAIEEHRTDRVLAQVLVESLLNMKRQERYFASTEQAWTEQVVYETSGRYAVQVSPHGWNTSQSAVTMRAQHLFPQGKGWELFLENNPRDQLPALLTRAGELLSLKQREANLGRYDVVLDATTAARLVDATFGIATQLDRAIGYEANAGGTSFLGPKPLALLGQLKPASAMVTITADRSLPGGCATVRWDDEGVIPETFALIRNGVLVDYQTTREQAAWLAPWYESRQTAVRSHGCAASPSAFDQTMQHTPNLALQPGQNTTSFTDLISDTTNGFAVQDGFVETDIRGKTGTISGLMREIVNGSLGGLVNMRILFDTTELWKNLMALGGAGSEARVGLGHQKGQPEQIVSHTVTAVPAKFSKVSVIRGYSPALQ